MAVRLSSTFLFRKLHQLTGIIPLGVFLLEHFYTNSKAMTGAADFNNAVRDLQSIPYIIFIETLGIFVPLIYTPSSVSSLRGRCARTTSRTRTRATGSTRSSASR